MTPTPSWWTVVLDNGEGTIRSLVCSSRNEFGVNNNCTVDEEAVEAVKRSEVNLELNSFQVNRVVNAILTVKKNTPENAIHALLKKLQAVKGNNPENHLNDSTEDDIERETQCLYIVERRNVKCARIKSKTG